MILTSLRARKQRQVRTRKECEPARGTHHLEGPDTKTFQDTERIRASEGHSQTGEPRNRNNSGHRKDENQQGALTFWKAQIQKQVRTQNECEPGRGTHVLENPGTETNQNTERMQASKGHSRPGEPRQGDISGHRKNASQRGALTSWRAQIQGQLKTRK